MLLVVGGQTRKIGKTSLVAALIEAVPEAAWTALKVTGHAHGDESFSNTRALERTDDYLLLEQTAPDDSDTGRYLAAGARRAVWLQARPGRLGHAVSAINELLAAGGNFILESNSVLEFVTPTFCLMVLDPEVAELKESCLRFLDRADAFVVRSSEPLPQEVAVYGKPVIRAVSPDCAPEPVVRLVRSIVASGNTAVSDSPDGVA
jgi:hypothetical protein